MITVTNLEQSAEDETRDGAAVASIFVEGPHNPHFPNATREFRSYVWINLYKHSQGGYVLDCTSEISDAWRTTWSVVRRVHDREAASHEAASFLGHALDMLRRSLAGEEVVTPGQRRDEAAQRAWEESAKCESLRREYEALRQALEASEDDAERCALRARASAAHAVVTSTRSRFIQAFHDAHDWTEFVDQAPDTERSAA